jgi:cytosine/adenosine deaminase-related metal-dependent hydrolase
MSWLDEYTFPRESRHQDLTLARTEYIKLVQRLLSNGTTTALYFASLHLEPTQLLAQLLHQVCTAFMFSLHIIIGAREIDCKNPY